MGIIKALQLCVVAIGLCWFGASSAQTSQNRAHTLNSSYQSQSLDVMSLASGNTAEAEPSSLASRRYDVGTFARNAGIGLGSQIYASGAFVSDTGQGLAEVHVPYWFQGTSFVIPHIRNSHTYRLLSVDANAAVTITRAGVTESLTLTQGLVSQFDAGSDNSISSMVESDVPILLMHVGTRGDAVWGDVYPVPPASLELWGARSHPILIGAAEDNTFLTVYSSEGTSRLFSLDAGERLALDTTKARDFNGVEAVRVSANKPISVVQYTDTNRAGATAFWPQQYLENKYGLRVDTKLVSVACPEPNTRITLYDGSNSPISQTCNGFIDSFPGKGYFEAASDGVDIHKGAYIQSTQPVYIYYETASNRLTAASLIPVIMMLLDSLPGPVISTPGADTTSNPFIVEGTALPSSEIQLYINGVYQQSVQSDEQGLWQVDAYLSDGVNLIKAKHWDGLVERDFSNQISVNYTNTISRDLSGLSIDSILVLTPGDPALPYTVNSGNLTVSASGKLVMMPGVIIEFGGVDQALNIDGSLSINGTEAEPVVLTSGLASAAKGDWYGIDVRSSASSVIIDHAVIEYALYGVRFNNVGGTVRNVLLRENTYGIYFHDIGSSMSLEDSLIERNDYGVYMDLDSSPVLTGNTVSSNESYGIFLEGPSTSPTDLYPQPLITGNNIVDNGGNNDDFYFSNFSSLAPRSDVINAQGNWWGSTVTSEIADNIYDFTDWFANPFADYGGYLDGPVPGGVPFNPDVTQILAIDADTTLLAGVDYEVLGDLLVPEGVTLTIESGARLVMGSTLDSSFDLIVDGALVLEAGSRIEFAGSDQALEVNGSLSINGTEADPVVLTSGLASPAKDDWHGIEVWSSASSVIIDYAVIEYALYGVRFNSVGGTVRNALIRENSYGVYLHDIGSNMSLEDSLIEDNGYGVYLALDSSPDLTGNTISSNETFGIYIDGPSTSTTALYPQPVTTGNNIVDNGGTNNDFYLGNFSSIAPREGTLNARGNWWGSTVESEIADKIFDFTDWSANPVVDHSGFLDGPVPDGVPFTEM